MIFLPKAVTAACPTTAGAVVGRAAAATAVAMAVTTADFPGFTLTWGSSNGGARAGSSLSILEDEVVVPSFLPPPLFDLE